MKTNIRMIQGPWTLGFVLDKHTLGSIHIGEWPNGKPKFDTTYTEVGNGVFLLKYRSDYSQVQPLVDTLYKVIKEEIREKINFIFPMPPSDLTRNRQPVFALAKKLAEQMDVGYATNGLTKDKLEKSLKNAGSKEEKLALLKDKFSTHQSLSNEENGPLNILLLDDLFDSGASMEEASKALQGCRSIQNVYVVALTWK